MTDIEILESTYFDKCTIKRKEKIKNPNTGVTETVEKIIRIRRIPTAIFNLIINYFSISTI